MNFNAKHFISCCLLSRTWAWKPSIYNKEGLDECELNKYTKLYLMQLPSIWTLCSVESCKCPVQCDHFVHVLQCLYSILLRDSEYLKQLLFGSKRYESLSLDYCRQSREPKECATYYKVRPQRKHPKISACSWQNTPQTCSEFCKSS